MSRTVIPFGSRMAQKKWSPALFLDIKTKSYFDKKFIGESDAYCVQRLTDLEFESGDEITFDLSIELRNRPTCPSSYKLRLTSLLKIGVFGSVCGLI